MRIEVGRVVNVDKDVNLADLSPMDRIIAAATNAYRNTSFYKRRYAETQEKREEQLRKVKEALANNLLSIISRQLRGNQLLADKGDECEAILLEVPARFNDHLKDVISTQEFMQYNITVIYPNKLVQKFAKAPLLLYVENRGVE